MILDQICKDVSDKVEFVRTQRETISCVQKQIEQMELFKTALSAVSSVMSAADRCRDADASPDVLQGLLHGRDRQMSDGGDGMLLSPFGDSR